MKSTDLYAELKQALSRPAPFPVYTADVLWTDSHTSRRMLEFHLDPDIDVSSRRTSFIDESVAWMAERFRFGEGKRVIDFGCGPGLYASRFAAGAAAVTGVDFSPESLEEELHEHGLAVETLPVDVAGQPYDPGGTEFAVAAELA